MSSRDNSTRELDRARTQQRQQFAQAVAGGQAAPLDRLGAQIKVGDLVIVDPEFPWMMDVVDISPVVDPRLPVGLLAVTLSVVARINVPAGAPTPRFIRVGMKSADGQHTDIQGATMVVAPEETEAEVPIPDGDEPPAGPKLVLTDVERNHAICGPCGASYPLGTKHDCKAAEPPKDDSDGRD